MKVAIVCSLLFLASNNVWAISENDECMEALSWAIQPIRSTSINSSVHYPSDPRLPESGVFEDLLDQWFIVHNRSPEETRKLLEKGKYWKYMGLLPEQ